MENVINNKRLSWKAKGLYTYIFLNKIKNCSAELLVKYAKDGRLSVLTALRELEKQGVLERIKTVSGKMEYKI